jgi:hypothetical protein
MKGSDSGPAAVDRDECAGEVARPVRHDKRDDLGDLVGLSRAAGQVVAPSCSIRSALVPPV